MEDEKVLESIKNVVEYCAGQQDCYPCKLRPFCKSLNPVIKMEFVYNQTKKALEANLSS